MPEITSAIPDAGPNPKQLRLRRIGLKVLTGPDAGQHAEFDHDVIRIGAQEGTHFQLTDTTVSRRHAEIARTQDGLVLRDLGSTNGTFLGPVRLREVFLGEARTFRVGQTEMEFALHDEVVQIVPVAETQFEGIVGRSVRMRELFAILDRVARTELTVLITGETGTGKELASRAIHQRSPRRSGPFVVFDCGAVARSLIESELFGHEKGAFTGAVATRAGVFEQANGGTIFLDELGELPVDLQPKLLRVLEKREVRRLGGSRPIPVDVRLISATNRNLRSEVRRGEFREDLYYRVAGAHVYVPPLRDRLEDLQLLALSFLEASRPPRRLNEVPQHIWDMFRAYRWPGNVRELRNAVQRVLIMPERALEGAGAPESGTPPMPAETDAVVPLRVARRDAADGFERAYLQALLAKSD